MYRVRVLSGYRVSIPKEVRERLGLKIGDELILEVEGSRIVLRPAFLPKDPVFTMLGIVGGEERELKEPELSVIKELEEKLKRSK
ncbi:MAG: hypothetical protein DRJ52_04870 [Thermoprotei archaeon]|nr:MAG: hypothetical protein DRJ52_04870 [Thermoprotei archaeon]RLE99329.1 MAG: hypothetical protein DRJ63_05730 [Thermoprotei archaeon]